MEETVMRERVFSARVGRLATLGPSGAPHLVPFCLALDGDTLYSEVDHKPKRTRDLRRLDNIRRDDRVSVLVDHYEEDWERVWWVRMDGTARLLDAGPERERALSLLSEKYEQYRENPPAGTVIAIDVHTWRSWSAS